MSPEYQTGSKGQTKDTMSQFQQQAQDKAGEVAQQARETAKQTASQQKNRAASSVDALAGALRQTGQNLNEQDQGAFGRIAEQAADRLSHFADDLQNKSVDEMIGEVEDFARREPGLFLGGALALGLFAARFFKSSARRQYGQGESGYYQGSFRQGAYSRRGYSQSYPLQSYPQSTFGRSGYEPNYTERDLADYRRETLDDDFTTGSYTQPDYTTPTSHLGSDTEFGTGGTSEQPANFPSERKPGSQPTSGTPRRDNE